MSREIKFRAWLPDMGHMIYSDNPDSMNGADAYIGLDSGSVGVYTIEMGDGDTECYSDEYNDATLMQFTGLHDKNGVEIYEGDFVVWTFRNPWGIRRIGPSEIEMKTATACETENGDKIECTGWFADGNTLDEECDIVGNIHENPGRSEE